MLLAALALTVGSLVWDRGTARFVDQLGASTRQRTRPGSAPRHVVHDDLAGLPAPVIRYFEFALKQDQPFIRRAHVQQTGMFARVPDRWSPFSAEQHYIVHPPGFVWDARIRMAPLVTTRVRDSYFARRGAMEAVLCSVIPIVSVQGKPEVAASALQRFLAETPWFPTALLPHAGVTWTAIDHGSARATLTDGELSVWIDFHFGENGEIISTSAQRYRTVNGTQVLTPWTGYFHDYERVKGMMVPRAGEAGWELPEGRFSYWRGRVGIAIYEY